MKILGIDPGATGGIAVTDGSSVLLAARLPILAKCLDTVALLDAVREYRPDVFCIEQQTGRYSTPTTYHHALGAIEAANHLQGLGLRIVTPAPATWQRLVLGKVPKGTTKDAALLACRRLFPEYSPKFRRDDGIIDALLLTEYARITQSHPS